MLRYALPCLGALFATLPLCAQEADVPRTATIPGSATAAFPYTQPEEVGLSSAALHSLGDRVAEWTAEGEIVGAEVLVIKDGKAVFHEAIGWNDRERGIPLQRNSIFRMRSMTKPLVGTAVLMLMEDGSLSLDDPAAKYLPSFDTDRSRAITIRQLLTHTAGLRDHGTEDFGLPQGSADYATLRALVDDIGAIGPDRTPDEFHYSDSGSSTLGAIVAAVSGMPVERFIEERILGPLRMMGTHTRFTPDAPWADRMNSTYRWSNEVCDFEQYWNPKMEQRFPYFRASGGLYSTAMDYARFMTMWMNKGRYGEVRLLSKATVEAALQPYGDRGEERSYGMHWMIRNGRMEDGLPAMFGHGGSDGTMAWASPTLDTVVLYFTQSRNRSLRDRYLFELGNVSPFDEHVTSRWNAEVDAAWTRLQDQPVDAGLAEVSPEVLERYTGSYVHDEDKDEVFVQDGALYYGVPDRSVTMPLHPLSPTSFIAGDRCSGMVFRITFLPAEDGTVDRYRLESREGWEGIFARRH